ncbi:DUF4365 domain-containing protein [Candidatus Poriferisodalis sp.]|uniref:DUF4365 domain-containing protein n=1 Tax=Candidatus Poriferisodalis sp. TaxID=3101277 RepID=UPI003B5C3452
MTRVSNEQSDGNKALHAVMAKFLDINWGPVSNAENDVGTDLWVQAVDEHRYLLRAVVGVQVKGGPSYFKRLGVQGDRQGWWYYESTADHFDDWAHYNAPHLIALHHFERELSYWAHVTPSAVKSTGQGRKIFVPEDQTIDAAHAGQLRAVAASRASMSAYEGTAVDRPPGTVPQGHELRFALIAPRLIAPHPNEGFQEAITAVEGLALVAQGRLRDLRVYADQFAEVPDPDDPPAPSDWAWGFVAAAWDWVFNDSTTALESAHASAPDSKSMAASGVLVACVLARCERHREAVAVLGSAASAPDMDAVDHAWVLVQRARFKAEIGDFDGCADDSNRAGQLLADQAADADVTAKELRAAVEWSRMLLADDDLSNFRRAMEASDTTVSWWRSQRASWGLLRAAEAGFRSWSYERSRIVFGALDYGASELFSAELCADVSAAHGSWASFASLGARLAIQHAVETAPEATDHMRQALDALRRSGDDKSLRLAVEHLLWDGPTRAVAEAVAGLRLAEWSRTSAIANLVMLEAAGDLLTEPAAAAIAATVTEIADDGGPEFVKRYRPSFNVEFYAYRALAGVMPAVGPDVHDDIAQFVARQLSNDLGPLAGELVDIVDWLDYTRVNTASRAELKQFALDDDTDLADRILGWFAENDDEEASNRLRSRAAQGDLDALAALGDVQCLSVQEAAALVDWLEDDARRRLAEMRAGSYESGSSAVLDALTLLNLLFPGNAKWAMVHEVLGDPTGLAEDKDAICTRIAALADDVPPAEREALIANLDSIAGPSRSRWRNNQIAGYDIVLAIALGSMSPDAAESAIVRLALGAPHERMQAGRLLGLGHCAAAQSLLAQLARDPVLQVRRHAARSIGRLCVQMPNPLLVTLADDISQRDGKFPQLALLDGMQSNSQPPTPVAEDVAEQLLHHLSAQVRRLATGLISAVGSRGDVCD